MESVAREVSVIVCLHDATRRSHGGGGDPRSLKVGERYNDEELMVLDLAAR